MSLQLELSGPFLISGKSIHSAGKEKREILKKEEEKCIHDKHMQTFFYI